MRIWAQNRLQASPLTGRRDRVTDMGTIEMYRSFLREDFDSPWADRETDKARGLPAPPREKPYPADATLIDLPAVDELNLGRMPVAQAMRQRRSRRQYSEEPITLDELSFLLWATQGIHRNLRATYSLRTVPAGGATHCYETYLSIHRVAGVEPGLYRYLPSEHKLCLLFLDDDMAERAYHARGGDPFIRKCGIYFIWTGVPYRREWRGSTAGKNMAIDAGHICQNLYLASEAIGCGTCATGVFGSYGPGTDELLGVDRRDEFTVYAATVGKVKSAREVAWTGQIMRVDAGGNVARLWVKSFSWWEGDVFVAEFPGATVSGYAEGDFVGIRGEIVDTCSDYDGWPFVRGTSIERQADPDAGFDPS
jgi:SagB-type dehydrogenase family enzyme